MRNVEVYVNSEANKSNVSGAYSEGDYSFLLNNSLEYIYDAKTNSDLDVTYTDIVREENYLTFNGTSSRVNQPMTLPTGS